MDKIIPTNNREKSFYLDYFDKHASGSVPYCMQVSSPKPGAHIIIVGALHGNEHSGVRAMVRFHEKVNKGEIQLNSGRVSMLLGNVDACKQAVRYIDKDLNRAFGDSETKTVEGKRASEINEFLKANGDAASLLDLHSVSKGDFKILVYNKENPQVFDLAKSISNIPLHFAYHPEHLPGTLMEAAGEQGIPGIIVECGFHGSKRGTNTALEHIERLLMHHKIMSQTFVSKPNWDAQPFTIEQYESIQAIRVYAGFRFLIDHITTGTQLVKGQKFAEDERGYHIAPEDCYVIVPSKLVRHTDYDAGFLGRLNIIT